MGLILTIENKNGRKRNLVLQNGFSFLSLLFSSKKEK